MSTFVAQSPKSPFSVWCMAVHRYLVYGCPPLREAMFRHGLDFDIVSSGLYASSSAELRIWSTRQ